MNRFECEHNHERELTEAHDFDCTYSQKCGFGCGYSQSDLIGELEDELTKTKKALAIAMEAIEFYGDIDSWHHLTTESIKYVKIALEDWGNGDFYKYDVDDSNVGGKLAREAKKQIEELLNNGGN